MAKLAFVFPGQGAQYVGMGRELAQRHPEFARYFDEASATLGFDLGALCFHGDEHVLKETANTQPAILTMSVACDRLLRDAGLKPAMVAGLSLGEYSALVSAGALSFAAAVPLVRQRGLFMQDAVPSGQGGMAAILGLEAEQVEAICHQVADTGHVSPANYNCPGQIVVAGEAAAVQRAVALAEAAGATRALLLPVGAPVPCKMRAPARERLQAVLAGVRLTAPDVPVVANVTAEPVQEPDAIRELLVRQVASPVRWEASVRNMLAAGIDTFIEVGPGRALTGFIRRIDRKLTVMNVEDPQSLDKVLDSLGRVC